MGPIVLSGQEAATNADILQGTRLQTAPADGFFTLECQASDNDATNNYTASLQMPGGDTPMNSVRIPCGNTAGLAGVLDSRTYLKITQPVIKGGHVVLSVTETGDTEFTWRVTWSPVR